MDKELLHKIEMLPENLKQEASDFIDFLISKAVKSGETQESNPKFGIAKGLVHMSADFDEPLDDFNEYMK